MATQINWRERLTAAAIHFIITAAIAALAAGLIFGIWFPGALAEMVGGRKLFFLVVGIDLILGPLISLVIYNTKKSRGKLILDYIIVGGLQLGALIYGVSVIAQSRPIFMVFTIDRLEVVSSIEIGDNDLAKVVNPQFKKRPLSGPHLVSVQLPDDAEKRNAVLFSGAAGKDLQFFPQYYQPYETALAQILKRSDSIISLQTKKPAAAQRLKMEINKAGLQEDRLRILPVHSRFGFWTALIDAENGRPIQYLPLDIDSL